MAKIPILGWIEKKIKRMLAIVQDTDTATQAISQGKYVIWHDDLFKASSAIAQGETLSSSNLATVSDGGMNDINTNLSNVANSIPSLSDSVSSSSSTVAASSKSVKTVNDTVASLRKSGDKSVTLGSGYWLIVTRYNATVNGMWIIYAYGGNGMGKTEVFNSASISISMGNNYLLSLTGNVSTTRALYIGS